MDKARRAEVSRKEAERIRNRDPEESSSCALRSPGMLEESWILPLEP